MTEIAEPPGDLAAKLDRWEQQDSQHWSGWLNKAKEAFGFVASDQYTSEERDELKQAGRMITTINRIGPMINAVSGAEIIDRQQVQYVPRTTEDAAVNEVLTMGAEWIRDRTRADREESDAFRDTLICGLGYTETVMNYDDDREGRVVIQRIDPIEVTPDSAARKANLLDARRFHRKRRIGIEEFEQSWPDATPGTPARSAAAIRSGGSPRTAYTNRGRTDDGPGEDEVEICEWQWFEFKTVFLTMDPDGQMVELTPEDHAEGQRLGVITQSVKQRRKVFWRALKTGSEILEYGPLPDGEFTIKAITGERDRNKGIFFGIVEAMKDPQRFANLFFSMLHHIVRTNAKGGIMAETDAFVDAKKAQESWARSDSITWLNQGGAQKIHDKPAPQIPPQITQLLSFAVAGIKDASGINEELLGLVGREQAGVLEHQRKQAAYAILAGYYDSLRFYRISQGELMLKYMQKYLPDGYLVRIIGQDGDARYVPMIKQPDTIKFDVIVDEAPAGPNQKEKVWGLIQNMQGILANAGPEIWGELVEYSPFPDKVNKALKGIFEQQAQPKQPDPMAIAERQAKTNKDQASAARDQAGATKDAATAQKTQAEAAIMTAQGALVQAQASAALANAQATKLIPTPFG